MAECLYCKKSGWLLQVDINGFCPGCLANYNYHVMPKIKQFQKLVSVVSKSQNHKIILSNIVSALEICSELSSIENDGFPVMETSVPEWVRMLKERFDECIIEVEQIAIEDARNKAMLAGTDATKIRGYSLSIKRLSDFSREYPSVESLKSAIVRLSSEQTALKFELTYRKAEVEEAKGKTTRAIEILIEAIMGLRHDSTPDDRQSQMFMKASTKIRDLGGNPPEWLC